MIDSVGYTDDGKVWLRILSTINNEPMAGVLTVTPDNARKIADSLMTAADTAGSLLNVGNGANIDKGGA